MSDPTRRNSSWNTTDGQTPLAFWLALLVVLIHGKIRSVLYRAYSRSPQVNHADVPESIIVIPTLGVQFETTRGLTFPLPWSDPLHRPHIAMSTSATFIPLEDISTTVINEGLRLWRVEYYLAVIRRHGSLISVAYDVSPPFHLNVLLRFESILTSRADRQTAE
jgi:hypothetical protein